MKRMISISLIAVLMVALCCPLAACSNKSELAGGWVSDELNETIFFYNDGTGLFDGEKFQWWVSEEDEIEYINFSGGRMDIDKTAYEISENMLYLDGYAFRRVERPKRYKDKKSGTG